MNRIVKRTIFIIEDDPHIVIGVGDALAFEGFNVVFARKGREGIVLAESASPDAIVIDMMLHDTNRYAVFESMQPQNGGQGRISPNKCQIGAMIYSFLHHFQLTQLLLRSHMTYYKNNHLVGFHWWPPRPLMLAVLVVLPVAILITEAALDFKHLAAPGSCMFHPTHDQFKQLLLFNAAALLTISSINWEVVIKDMQGLPET